MKVQLSRKSKKTIDKQEKRYQKYKAAVDILFKSFKREDMWDWNLTYHQHLHTDAFEARWRKESQQFFV